MAHIVQAAAKLMDDTARKYIAKYVADMHSLVAHGLQPITRQVDEALSHCSISWLMLMTTARALGDHETEELAEQGYRDSARLVIELDRALPRVVVAEMQKDGLPAQDVAEWASHVVHEAWIRDAVRSGAA